VAVLALVTLAGCRSTQRVQRPPRDTREPPIAVRQQSGNGIQQTSATESVSACSH
jgi:hypothetical protein